MRTKKRLPPREIDPSFVRPTTSAQRTLILRAFERAALEQKVDHVGLGDRDLFEIDQIRTIYIKFRYWELGSVSYSKAFAAARSVREAARKLLELIERDDKALRRFWAGWTSLSENEKYHNGKYEWFAPHALDDLRELVSSLIVFAEEKFEASLIRAEQRKGFHI